MHVASCLSAGERYLSSSPFLLPRGDGPTHQLILAAPAEGFLDSRIPPESTQGRDVELEGGRLDGHPSFVLKGHQKHPVLLILRVLPRDPQLVPCVNQNPAALRNDSDKKVSDTKIKV